MIIQKRVAPFLIFLDFAQNLSLLYFVNTIFYEDLDLNLRFLYYFNPSAYLSEERTTSIRITVNNSGQQEAEDNTGN